MDGAGAIAEGLAGAAVRDGLDLGKDGEGDLLGRFCGQVKADRREDPLGGAVDGQFCQHFIGSPAGAEDAEVGEAKGKLVQDCDVAGEIVGHEDDRRVGGDGDAFERIVR